jgi:hypothetical protein
VSTRAIPVQASGIVKRGSLEIERVTRALLDLADQGLRPHCSDRETHHLWLSEEITERRTAVELCRCCPVLKPCGHAVDARRERFGVEGCRSRPSAGAKADR